MPHATSRKKHTSGTGYIYITLNWESSKLKWNKRSSQESSHKKQFPNTIGSISKAHTQQKIMENGHGVSANTAGKVISCRGKSFFQLYIHMQAGGHVFLVYSLLIMFVSPWRWCWSCCCTWPGRAFCGGRCTCRSPTEHGGADQDPLHLHLSHWS